MSYQVVLHESDNASQSRKNETRNLGLQSIVNHEDQITSELIYDASVQKDVAASIENTIQKINSVISNLTWIGNNIYNVIHTAYLADNTKTQKFIDIQSEALKEL